MLLISCISPVSTYYEETISTLRFACRAKKVSLLADMPVHDTNLQSFLSEIARLRHLLSTPSISRAISEYSLEDETGNATPDVNLNIIEQLFIKVNSTTPVSKRQSNPFTPNLQKSSSFETLSPAIISSSKSMSNIAINPTTSNFLSPLPSPTISNKKLNLSNRKTSHSVPSRIPSIYTPRNSDDSISKMTFESDSTVLKLSNFENASHEIIKVEVECQTPYTFVDKAILVCFMNY